MYYTIETPWGETSSGWEIDGPTLDSWPDPEAYVHYPSGQLLAYMDIRNFNRTWPGRKWDDHRTDKLRLYELDKEKRM